MSNRIIVYYIKIFIYISILPKKFLYIEGKNGNYVEVLYKNIWRELHDC